MMEKDYPMTLDEFETEFASEEACRNYIFKLRWPNGFVCPKCNHVEAWYSKGLYECKNCYYKLSPITGTLFQDTHKSLKTWFRVIWWVTVQRNGASAHGLQPIIGLKSYKTAWIWLQKLRRAMVSPDREKLHGFIEVDETYIGGKEEGKRGRAFEKKSLVVVAVEVNDKKVGRIRLKMIEDASADSLHPFVKHNIEKGSTIITDKWASYNGLNDFVHVAQPSNNSHLKRAHLVITLIKRWLLGTHQGAAMKEHLEYYLDEFTFRFNRRKSKYRGKLFYRLLENAILIEPIKYNDLTKGTRKNNIRK
jgi:transposase-like protein